MQQKKIISMRLSEDVVAKLDELAQSSRHWTRSSIVNNLLETILDCATKKTLYDMMRAYKPKQKGYTVEFKEPREIL